MTVMEPMISFETIREVHRAERDERLGKLPDGFFRAARQWLLHKKGAGDTSSLLEAESAKKLLEDVVNRRQRKIMMAALGSVRGAAPPTNMTLEEARFFDQLTAILKSQQNEAKEQLFGADFTIEQKMEEARRSIAELRVNMDVKSGDAMASQSAPKTAEPSTHNSPDQKPFKASNGTTRVRMLLELPCFVDKDGNRYGPFKPGETTEVPDDVLNLLLMRRAAEQVMA